MKRTQHSDALARPWPKAVPVMLLKTPKYIPKSPHEAPPTRGILGLYNKGTVGAATGSAQAAGNHSRLTSST